MAPVPRPADQGQVPEVGIYKRKQVSNKNKHALNQENDQETKKFLD